jgi:hypothetical protein
MKGSSKAGYKGLTSRQWGSFLARSPGVVGADPENAQSSEQIHPCLLQLTQDQKFMHSPTVLSIIPRRRRVRIENALNFTVHILLMCQIIQRCRRMRLDTLGAFP